MFIILGGTGHIGSALAQRLLARGEAVTVVTRNPEARADWEARGARVAQVDVRSVDALRRVFAEGKRAFLLNPPAAPDTDTAVEERKTMQAILAALEGSKLEKVVAESTYGAQPGDAIGDLGVLYDFEEGLQAQRIPTAIIRGAYYMSNWDSALTPAREDGLVPTLYPADFTLPMVAPADVAELAARLLTEPADRSGLHFVEGPERYSMMHVAAAFADALHRPVSVASTPQEHWHSTLRGLGFSDAAATSMANMSRITLEQGCELPEQPVRGKTTLAQYVRGLTQS